MDKEKFQKIVNIDERIKNLNYVKASIEPTQDYKLCYIDVKGGRGVPEWKIKHISDLLEKHDLMIREEIQKELESLDREIEEL